MVLKQVTTQYKNVKHQLKLIKVPRQTLRLNELVFVLHFNSHCLFTRQPTEASDFICSAIKGVTDSDN